MKRLALALCFTLFPLLSEAQPIGTRNEDLDTVLSAEGATTATLTVDKARRLITAGQYKEDVASADGHFGQACYSVRNDTATAGTNTSGDYQPLKSNSVGATYTDTAHNSATYTTEVAVAFGDITASYVTALTNTAKLRFCYFSNQTDDPVSFADQGGTAIISGLPASGYVYLDFASNGRYQSNNIQIKYTVGAPSSGSVYINCYS